MSADNAELIRALLGLADREICQAGPVDTEQHIGAHLRAGAMVRAAEALAASETLLNRADGALSLIVHRGAGWGEMQTVREILAEIQQVTR